ncbi:hypothetical protein [Nocardia brasiliensis]|uniref:hypothetical protein n=1 Tax=Nocardia brasiliensis TaxID=37326 RepID=UPI002454D83C|nr:hypothetical protein [Nocardia brasiliensis]
MAIEVHNPEYEESIVFESAVGVRTEADYNNLEVLDADGSIIAVYAGGHWSSALVLTDRDDG